MRKPSLRGGERALDAAQSALRSLEIELAELLADEVADRPSGRLVLLGLLLLRRARALGGSGLLDADVLHGEEQAAVDGIDRGDLDLHLVALLQLAALGLDHLVRGDQTLDALAQPHEHAV